MKSAAGVWPDLADLATAPAMAAHAIMTRVKSRLTSSLRRTATSPAFAVLCVLGATSLVLGAAVLANCWAGGDRDDLAAWVEALATFAAFTAAVIAALLVAGSYRIERGRERRWEDEERQAQARLVAVWVDHEKIENDFAMLPGLRNISPKYSWHTVLRMRNASDVPVTDARVAIYADHELIGVQSLGLVPPTTDSRFDFLHDSIEEYLESLPGKGRDLRIFTTAVVFSDSAGRSWHRDQFGKLNNAVPDWAWQHGEVRSLSQIDGAALDEPPIFGQRRSRGTHKPTR